MKDFQPRELAEKFLELNSKALVIPLDDVDLSSEDAFRRERRLESSGVVADYMKELKGIIKFAPISRYFRCQILWECRNQCTWGWTRIGAMLDTTKQAYAISLDEGKYGFFDPQTALDVEMSFFYFFAPYLAFKEESGMFNPVSWREWAKNLAERNFNL